MMIHRTTREILRAFSPKRSNTIYDPVCALETKLDILERNLSKVCSQGSVDPMKIDEYADKVLYLDKEIRRVRSALQIVRKTRYSK